MTDQNQKSVFGNVVAHGLDVVDMQGFSRLMQKVASNYLDRYFTVEELATVNGISNRIEKLASRFAIKEAVLKALGTGWGDGIAFTDVEVVTKQTGEPSVVLHRRLATVAKDKGIAFWLVSASHTDSVAMASVIALSS